MRTTTWLGLGLLLAGLARGAAASPLAVNTNVNLAFTYYNAFLLHPSLSDADREYLFGRSWEGQHLEARLGELISRYSNSFKLMRQAAHSTAPCDWGVNLAEGSAMELPRLARAKHLTQMALLEAAWKLQNGDQAGAREDLLAVLALSRNLTKDNLLISVLVGIAIDAMVTSSVAANFYQLDAETLKQAATDMGKRANEAGSRAIWTEKYVHLERFVEQIKRLQEQNPGNDAEVLRRFRAEFPRDAEAEAVGQTSGLDLLMQRAGGTSAGLLRLYSEAEPIYDEMAAVMTLPYSQYVSQEEALFKRARTSANPLIAAVPSFDKARRREFRIQVSMAMVRAAAEYKRRGMDGLNSVMDPCGSGPFAYKRFVLDGVDRGFELQSAVNENGSGTLIFVEKAGPPFLLTGPRAGQPREPQDPKAAEKTFQKRYGIQPFGTNK